MTLQDSRKKAATNLWDWQHGGDSFYCMLYTLIAKADYFNRIKLSLAFPREVEAFKEWENSHNDKEYFLKSGLYDK